MVSKYENRIFHRFNNNANCLLYVDEADISENNKDN